MLIVFVNMACLLENDNSFAVSIPSHETKNNVTYYTINVTVGSITWTVSHRYKDFVELNDVLVTDHCIAKELLPQKKLIGNRDPEFVERRKMSLEGYLRTVVSYLQKAMPTILIRFLEFDKYDITYILQNMAYKFCADGDSRIHKSDEYTFNPLQLFAISQRLHKCCFPAESVNNEFEFSNVMEFCQKLKTVVVRGGRSNIGTSNLIYNSLPFEMTIFRSAVSIYFYNVQLSNVTDFGCVSQNVSSIVMNNCNIKQFADALLCDKVHKILESPDNNIWRKVQNVDFSWNELKRIDEGVALVPDIRSLTLDGNQIRFIENTESLSNLTYLCISANNLTVDECLYSKLKNIVRLNLSQNKITKLSPFAKLTKLKELNLGSNCISESREIKYVSDLPELEYLILTGNHVSTIIDYRIKVFEYFGNRAKDICLDNERPSQKELDTAAVLRALATAREGRPPVTVSFN